MTDEQSAVFQKESFTIEKRIHVLESRMQNHQDTTNEIGRKVNDQTRKIQKIFKEIKSEKAALESFKAEIPRSEISKESLILNKKVSTSKKILMNANLSLRKLAK
jgi:uncharacterized coiled-coil protein SlyX